MGDEIDREIANRIEWQRDFRNSLNRIENKIDKTNELINKRVSAVEKRQNGIEVRNAVLTVIVGFLYSKTDWILTFFRGPHV